MQLHKSVLAGAVLLFAAAFNAQAVWGEELSQRPVSLICPFSPGLASDTAMRALAAAASKHLGRPVEVKNLPGADGTLGAQQLMQAEPDGYTLSQMASGVFRVPHLRKTEFDPTKDFTWIIGVTAFTYGVAVRGDAPWQTWQDFVDYARANPGKVSYTTPGIGSPQHVTMEALAKQTGVRWNHVVAGDGIAALGNGGVDAFASSTGWGQHIQSGKIRMLVTWGEHRTKRWPDVPTLKELGYGVVSNLPYGLAGPKGMTPALVQQVHDAFRKAMAEPEFRAALDELGQESWYRSSEEYTAYALASYHEQKEIVERFGLKR